MRRENDPRCVCTGPSKNGGGDLCIVDDAIGLPERARIPNSEVIGIIRAQLDDVDRP